MTKEVKGTITAADITRMQGTNSLVIVGTFNGVPIRTSRVQRIYTETNGELVVETLNSLYILGEGSITLNNILEVEW